MASKYLAPALLVSSALLAPSPTLARGPVLDGTVASAGVPESGAVLPTPCVMPGSVAYHLAQGQDQGPNLRTFDYDPYGQALARLKGHYNKNTGELRWRAAYDPSHYKVETLVEGHASFTGEDQAISYTLTTTDIRSAVIEAVEVEEEWVGCTVTKRTRPQGAGDEAWKYEWGTFDGTTYSYSAEPTTPLWGGDACDDPYNLPLTYGSLNTTDMTWRERFEGSQWCWDTGVEDLRWGNADGWTKRYWKQYLPESPYYGTDERFIDGTTNRYGGHTAYGTESFTDFHANGWLDYDGNGPGEFYIEYVDWETGQMVKDWITPLQFVANACTVAGSGEACGWWFPGFATPWWK